MELYMTSNKRSKIYVFIDQINSKNNAQFRTNEERSMLSSLCSEITIKVIIQMCEVVENLYLF